MNKFANPEAFQFEAASILAAGYECFPLKFDWQLDLDSERYPTQEGASRRTIQLETIRWLKAQDYLSGKGLVRDPNPNKPPHFRDLQLTERALVALNAVPEALQGKEPLGKRLRTAVASHSWEPSKHFCRLPSSWRSATVYPINRCRSKAAPLRNAGAESTRIKSSGPLPKKRPCAHSLRRHSNSAG